MNFIVFVYDLCIPSKHSTASHTSNVKATIVTASRASHVTATIITAATPLVSALLTRYSFYS